MCPPIKLKCLRGHDRIPENLDRNKSCKLCSKIRLNKWRKENPALQKNKEQKYRDSHKEHLVASSHRYYANHPEKMKAISLKRVIECEGFYIAQLLGAKTRELPPEIIEIKQLTLKLRRGVHDNQK